MKKIHILFAFLIVAALLNGCNKGLPSVETSEVTQITAHSAECGGEVADNGDAVLVRGICWSEHGKPTVKDLHTTDNGGAGSFTNKMEDLLPNTTYHVRAYAMNSSGVAYGTEKKFTTMSEGWDTQTPTGKLCIPQGWKLVSATSSPACHYWDGSHAYYVDITNLINNPIGNVSGWSHILVFDTAGIIWKYEDQFGITHNLGVYKGRWHFDNPNNPQTIDMTFFCGNNDHYTYKILNLSESEFKFSIFWDPATYNWDNIYSCEDLIENQCTWTYTLVPANE